MTPYLLYDTPVKNKEDSVKIALWNFNRAFFCVRPTGARSNGCKSCSKYRRGWVVER